MGRSLSLRVVFGLLLLVGVAAFAGQAKGFAGRFQTRDEEGSEYVLELTVSGADRLTGRLLENGVPMAVQASVQGTTATGTAKLEQVGVTFGLRLARSADAIELTLLGPVDMSEVATRLRFAAPAAPSPRAAGKPAAARKPVAKGKTPAAKGAGKQHPAGFAYALPAKWGSALEQGVTALVPPGQRSNPNGSWERHLMTVGAIGVSADDPHAAGVLHEHLAKGLPFLQPKGSPEGLSSPLGPAAAFTFGGVGPNGKAWRVRFYGVSRGGLMIGVLATGDPATVDARHAALKGLVASMKPASARQDPALVGAWRMVRSQHLGEPSRSDGRGTAQRSQVLALQPDGSCVEQTRTRVVVSGDGYFGDTGPQTSTRQGRWFASGGALVLVWEGFETDYASYTASGDGLRLSMGSGATVVYARG